MNSVCTQNDIGIAKASPDLIVDAIAMTLTKRESRSADSELQIMLGWDADLLVECSHWYEWASCTTAKSGKIEGCHFL
jgi:hypothetical protein